MKLLKLGMLAAIMQFVVLLSARLGKESVKATTQLQGR